VLPIEPVAFKLAVGNFKKKMDEINPLSALISFICDEDTISVPEIVYSTIWGSFVVQFLDDLRNWDHLRARTGAFVRRP